MRMTSFIVGSVLGMAGAMVLMQRKPNMAKAVQSAMTDMKGNMVSKAVSKFTKSNQSQSQMGQQQKAKANSQAQSASNHQHHPTNHQMNVSMIEGIIDSDPQLQSVVEDIKSDSKSVQH